MHPPPNFLTENPISKKNRGMRIIIPETTAKMQVTQIKVVAMEVDSSKHVKRDEEYRISTL